MQEIVTRQIFGFVFPFSTFDFGFDFDFEPEHIFKFKPKPNLFFNLFSICSTFLRQNMKEKEKLWRA